MKRLVYLVLIVISISCSQEPQHVIILMGGQSNMVGAGRMEDLGDHSFPGNIQYFGFGLNSRLVATPERFGPEVEVARLLSEQHPQTKFTLIKYAIGGSSLLDWAPDYDSLRATVTGNARFGSMYNEFMIKIDSLQKIHGGEVGAMLWMQGERDARIPEAGVEYLQNFQVMIESFRKDLGKPTLPFLFGMVNAPAERYPALDTVRASQLRIAETLEQTYAISTDDVEKWDDNLHYSSEGQLELGRRFGYQLIEILPIK